MNELRTSRYVLVLILYCFLTLCITGLQMYQQLSYVYIMMIAAWSRNIAILLHMMRDIRIVSNQGEVYQNMQPLQVIVQMAMVDENYIGNNFFTFSLVVFCWVYLTLENLSQSFFNTIILIQNILILIAASYMKLKEMQFPFYKMNLRKDRVRKANVFLRILILYLFLRIWPYLFQLISIVCMANLGLFVSVMVQVFCLVAVLWGIFQDVKSIKCDFIAQENIPCYNGWMTLITSLGNQQAYKFLQYTAVVCAMGQLISCLLASQQKNSVVFYYIAGETLILGYMLGCSLYRTFVWNLLKKCGYQKPVALVYERALDMYTSEEPQMDNFVALPSVGERDEVLQRRLSMAKNKECAICLDVMLTNLIALDCHELHIFHSNCIREWKRHMNMCPLCRKQIDQIYV